MSKIKTKMTADDGLDGVKGKHYFLAGEWANWSHTVELSIEVP